MKWLGEGNVILEVKIIRTANDLSLFQSLYVENILKKFDFLDVFAVRTRFNPIIHLTKNK